MSGGSSFTYGIYKKAPDSKPTTEEETHKSDGKYSWYTKYGKTRDEAFQKIKSIIIKIIEFVQNKNFGAIDNLDLSISYK